MKFATPILLTLASGISAVPVEEALQKRAICTTNGYTYSCAGATSTTRASTSSAATATRSATTTTTTRASTTAGSSSPTGTTGYSSGSTANDVNNGVCAQLTVIFARGTGETGTIGTVAGPPMFKQLSTDLNKKVAFQGVDYPASSSGNSNQGADGGPAMASLVTKALQNCPNTKIALSGYSQGAMVVHDALNNRNVDSSKIAAIVVFGDPQNGQKFGSVASSKTLSICGTSDSICNSGPTNVSGGHTDYGSQAGMAASFIEKTAGVSA